MDRDSLRQKARAAAAKAAKGELGVHDHFAECAPEREETLIAKISASYGQTGGRELANLVGVRNGELMITSRWIRFFSPGRSFPRRDPLNWRWPYDVPIQRMAQTAHTTEQVVIGDVHLVLLAGRRVADRFTEELRHVTTAARQRSATVAESGSGTSDIAGQLERLRELHVGGALTAEEYAAAKSRLLG